MVNADFWKSFKGKRVFVTGDTGFKGSWLSLWLHRLGADVVGYALPAKGPEQHFTLLGLEKLTHHLDGDIRDLGALTKAIKGHQPEFLFHLAAQSLVQLSYSEPKLTFDTNVCGSVNVLEAVRQTPSVRALVYVTSDKCYRNKETLRGYRETDELGGYDPYSGSKAAAEMAFSAYLDSFFKGRQHFGAASVRAGNVIGGGDWAADRIVPDIVRALRQDQPVFLRHPSSTRPWQNVLDPLAGYLRLAASLYADGHTFSGSWNFGPDERSVRTVEDLARTFIKFWGSGLIEMAPPSLSDGHEAGLLQLNCDKARESLGWQPRWPFEAGIQTTVEWYKGFHEKRPVLPLSQGQIESFMR